MAIHNSETKAGRKPTKEKVMDLGKNQGALRYQVADILISNNGKPYLSVQEIQALLKEIHGCERGDKAVYAALDELEVVGEIGPYHYRKSEDRRGKTNATLYAMVFKTKRVAL